MSAERRSWWTHNIREVHYCPECHQPVCEHAQREVERLNLELDYAYRRRDEANQRAAELEGALRTTLSALSSHSPGGAECPLPHGPCDLCNAVAQLDNILTRPAPRLECQHEHALRLVCEHCGHSVNVDRDHLSRSEPAPRPEGTITGVLREGKLPDTLEWDT